MDYQIVQMNPNTWRIEDNGVRIFLLQGEDRALLIDSGMQLHNARDIAQTLTSLPVELLNTHADMDHIGSNEQFDSFYMHPAEEANYRRSGKGGRLIVGAGKVMNGEISGAAEELFGTKITAYDLGFTVLLCDE